MKVFFGFENMEMPTPICGVHDQQEDLIITPNREKFLEAIPLLSIQPLRKTLLFEDYGFTSDSDQTYLYLDMICVFYIKEGKEQEKNMFLLQTEEELIAEIIENEQRYLVVGNQHRSLVKKWASAYKLTIEFILFQCVLDKPE
ncbi:hypothetical protein ABE65_014015 [Fictibacillus phosphorivorans]|uniref:Uncharacterized protein n=1 Tax=Fictibacillus phosphorivorans TaxID=1221500 RepID=A0A160IND4_9BACL|nr:hypothetical protein [Fictibacillus phosphorivorans]ANC77853.1 hypothetical protein ABE65_014015 [Fictibacillus phosphorivorans]